MSDQDLRKLDAEIHERVFGLPVTVDKFGHPWPNEAGLAGRLLVPRYSSDIRRAWEVVEKMGQWMFDMEWGFAEGVCFGDWLPIHANLSAAGWRVKVGSHTVAAPTFPEAVCRASLEATKTKLGRQS